jgi:hypothetical protein
MVPICLVSVNYPGTWYDHVHPSRIHQELALRLPMSPLARFSSSPAFVLYYTGPVYPVQGFLENMPSTVLSHITFLVLTIGTVSTIHCSTCTLLGCVSHFNLSCSRLSRLMTEVPASEQGRSLVDKPHFDASYWSKYTPPLDILGPL